MYRALNRRFDDTTARRLPAIHHLVAFLAQISQNFFFRLPFVNFLENAADDQRHSSSHV